MIQRIQSLLFLGAALCFFALFYFDISTFTNEAGDTVTLDLCYIKASNVANEVVNNTYVTYAPYISIVLSVGLLGTIFLYRNRKLQILVGNVFFLLNLLFLVFTLMAPDKLVSQLGTGEWKQSLGIGYYLPILSIVLIIFAVKAIKKDEKLVKAADRLR